MTTPRRLVLEPKGLILAPGQLSRAPGALARADDVVVEAPGLIRSRRGFERMDAAKVGGPVWKLLSHQLLGDTFLYSFGTNANATGLARGDGTVTPTTISGAYTLGPDTRMQHAVSLSNHYLTSQEGVRRLLSDFTPEWAGAPKGLCLDLTGVTPLTGTGSWLADGYAAAYRVAWGRKDVQGVELVGAPASRSVVRNSTGTGGYAGGIARNVVCRVLLPKALGTTATGLTAGAHFFRLYRSKSRQISAGPPDEELQLVHEQTLVAGDITAGYVDVTDSTPDSLLGPFLYTNPNSGEDGIGGPGVAQANDPPPRAYALAEFADCLWAGQCTYPQRLTFTVLSVTAGTGLTAGDTLTIAGVTYTAIAPGAPAADQFVVYVASTTSENIERTALNLVEAINKSASNTSVYAYYQSGPNDLPGTILLEHRQMNASGFTALASAHGSAYRPSLATAASSTAAAQGNWLAFSKAKQADAWAPVNLLSVGKPGSSIRALRALRNSLFVFTDQGLWRVLGRTWADFSVQEVDPTFRLLGPETVCVVDDAIYAWAQSGVARVTEGGVEYVSNAIEPLLQEALSTATLATMQDYAFAVGAQYQHRALFFYPIGSTKKQCELALCFDVRSRAWTRWWFRHGAALDGRSCGMERPSDGKLWLGDWNNASTDAYPFRERRDFLATDFRDTGNDGNTYALNRNVAFVAQLDSPEVAVHWDEVHVFFEKSETFSSYAPAGLTVQMASDNQQAGISQTVTPATDYRQARAIVPRAVRRAPRIDVSLLDANVSRHFGVEGIAVLYRASRTNRTTVRPP